MDDNPTGVVFKSEPKSQLTLGNMIIDLAREVLGVHNNLHPRQRNSRFTYRQDGGDSHWILEFLPWGL